MAPGKTVKAKPKSQSRSAAAGLIFPVGRCASYLKTNAYCPWVSEQAAIVMSAVLEYLTRELLELAV
jgi:hypothetical protein